MTKGLKEHLIGLIKHQGDLPVSEYMRLCLYHPTYGYYNQKSPIGRSGDFITAPEVSQMFGEIIGLWVANIWHNMGNPKRLLLVELGGGYGSLMADMLRAQNIVADMHKALEVHMVETSPALSALQQQKLEKLGYDIPRFWHKDIKDIPTDAPVIFIGNEFFDALPVHHIQKKNESWYERCIGLDVADNFIFTLSEESLNPPATHPLIDEAKDGDILEFSTDALAIISQIAERIKTQKGACLFADYGYAYPHFGETLQAVKNHEFVDVLAHVGEADITAHVDFGSLAQVAFLHDVKILPLLSQGAFLNILGISERSKALKQNAPSEVCAAIDSQIERLTGEKQMGNLFKIFMCGHRELAMPFDSQDEIWGKSPFAKEQTT